MKTRLLIRTMGGATLLLAWSGAAMAAMSPQSGPVPGGNRAAVADPDEHLERLSDQTRQRAKRGTFDPSSAKSVMDFGTAAATRNTGPVSSRPY